MVIGASRDTVPVLVNFRVSPACASAMAWRRLPAPLSVRAVTGVLVSTGLPPSQAASSKVRVRAGNVKRVPLTFIRNLRCLQEQTRGGEVACLCFEVNGVCKARR